MPDLPTPVPRPWQDTWHGAKELRDCRKEAGIRVKTRWHVLDNETQAERSAEQEGGHRLSWREKRGAVAPLGTQRALRWEKWVSSDLPPRLRLPERPGHCGSMAVFRFPEALIQETSKEPPYWQGGFFGLISLYMKSETVLPA